MNCACVVRACVRERVCLRGINTRWCACAASSQSIFLLGIPPWPVLPREQTYSVPTGTLLGTTATFPSNRYS